MWGSKNIIIFPKCSFINNSLGIWRRCSYFNIIRLIDPKIISICSKQFFSLVMKIEQPQHLRTNQIVITINNNHNLFKVTIRMRRLIDITQGLLILLINIQLQLILFDTIHIHILMHLLWRAILGVIINIDNMIVCILLLENRVEIIEDIVSVIVLITRNNDA